MVKIIEHGHLYVRRGLRGQLDLAIVSRIGAAEHRPVSGLREWDLAQDALRLWNSGRGSASQDS